MKNNIQNQNTKNFSKVYIIFDEMKNTKEEKEVDFVYTKYLQKYLEYDVDWSVAPSEAKNVNFEFINKINNDVDINPFIFDIDEKV